MRSNIAKGASVASVIILPMLSVGFAIIGRTSFWAISSEFYTQLPAYLLVLIVLEVLQAGVVLFGKNFKFWTTRDSGTRWIIWGAYQLACGIALIRLFDAGELWLASTVPVYAGFASIVLGVYLKTVSADKQE